MDGQRPAAFDIVDLIGAIAAFLRRHPFSSLLVALEGIFFVAILSVLPEVVATVLGFPTYPVHLVLVAIGGGTWWRGLAIGLLVALTLDLIWSTLFLRREAQSNSA